MIYEYDSHIVISDCTDDPHKPTQYFLSEDSATYTHTHLINDSSTTITDLTLGLRNGPAHEAGLSVDASKGHASSRMVNREWSFLPSTL